MPPLGFSILFPLLLLLGGISEIPAEMPFATATIHKSVCLLPPHTGPCLAAFRRWYFSPRMRRCLLFSYGGCQGNGNNFETQEACEHRCQDSPPPQLKPGTCPLVVQDDSRICGQFCSSDNSCPGSELCCKTSCGQECQLPLEAQLKPGTCPLVVQDGSRMCGRFCSSDNSCPGSELCCKTSCGQECQLPLEDKRGYCPRASVRPGTLRHCLSTCVTDEDCGWGIQIPVRKCCTVGCQQMCMEAEEEHPGLCPKRNVVQTFVPCNDTCSDDRDCPLVQKCCFTGCSLGCLNSVRSDRCQLPPKRGPCQARIRRFYYSPSQKKCLRFFYGGCGGNSNNFKTKKECEATCGEINPEVCKEPKDNDKCLPYSEFFHYNSTSHTCHKSTFCNCKGEVNRFTTKLECLMVCGNSTISDKE